MRSLLERLRGCRSGSFREPADSGDARALSAAWAAAWPGHAPDAWEVRALPGAHHVRLDGLADGRLPHGDADDADVVDLYLRLVRRLRKLHEDEPLVIVGHEYGRRNIMAGHFRRAFPEAWPWRTDRPYGGVQRGGEPITYFWVVGPGVEAGELRRLLREIVRDEALTVVLAPSSFTWLFYPFGQAGDLAVVDRWRFDLVLAEFEAWVCHHDDVPDDGFPPGA